LIVSCHCCTCANQHENQFICVNKFGNGQTNKQRDKCRDEWPAILAWRRHNDRCISRLTDCWKWHKLLYNEFCCRTHSAGTTNQQAQTDLHVSSTHTQRYTLLQLTPVLLAHTAYRSARDYHHRLAVWLSGNDQASINVVALCQTRFVPGWVTICGWVNHLGM